MSCKQAHEERVDVGPQFDPVALDDILSKATQGASPVNLQKGHRLNYEESIRVANQDPNILQSETSLNVIDRRDDADTESTRITVHRTQSFRKDGGFRTVESESTFAFPAPEASAAGILQTLADNARMSLEVDALAGRPTKVTYHNLRVSEGDIDPPEKVKDRSGCGGLSPCQIHVTYLSYDEVLWMDNGTRDIRTYDFALTGRLPYVDRLYGVMVTGCVGLYLPVNDKTVYVRDCQYLTDLQK